MRPVGPQAFCASPFGALVDPRERQITAPTPTPTPNQHNPALGTGKLAFVAASWARTGEIVSTNDCLCTGRSSERKAPLFSRGVGVQYLRTYAGGVNVLEDLEGAGRGGVHSDGRCVDHRCL